MNLSRISHPIGIDLNWLLFYLETTYETLEDLVTALKEGEVDAILVDMYLPSKRKDVFNGTWFEAFLIPKGFSYGAVLRGDAVKLEKDLKNLKVLNNVQTKFLVEGAEDDKSIKEVNRRNYIKPTGCVVKLPCGPIRMAFLVSICLSVYWFLLSLCFLFVCLFVRR